MDKLKETVDTFNKYAFSYQDKYLNFAPYLATCRSFLTYIDKEEGEMLDVSCGPASLSRFLSEFKPGFRVTGVDLAPAMIELARQNVPNGQFRVMDCREIASLGKTYDLILFGFCFPYLSETEVARLLSDAAAMLNRGGLMYISTMEGDSARSGFTTNDAGDGVYTYYHQAAFLNRQLKENGMEVIYTERKPLPQDDGDSVQDLFLFARKSR